MAKTQTTIFKFALVIALGMAIHFPGNAFAQGKGKGKTKGPNAAKVDKGKKHNTKKDDKKPPAGKKEHLSKKHNPQGKALAHGKNKEKGKGHGLALGKDKVKDKDKGNDALAALLAKPVSPKMLKKADRAKAKPGKMAKERRKHLKRMAKIRRLKAIAKAKGNTTLLKKTTMLTVKEKERHQKARTRLAEKKNHKS